MIHTTRWSPDTCSCVLEYTWDDSVPQDQIVITPSAVVERCATHAALPSNLDIFNSVAEENPRKNNSYKTALDTGPSSLYDIVEGKRTLKDNVTFEWEWQGIPPNRTLNVRFTGVNLTNNQKSTIQSELNNKFGTGKVILD